MPSRRDKMRSAWRGNTGVGIRRVFAIAQCRGCHECADGSAVENRVRGCIRHRRGNQRPASSRGKIHEALTLIKTQFNTISPENVLKWERVHPSRGTYDFAPGRPLRRLRQCSITCSIIGHTLVWHSQVPRWVFQDADGKPLGRDALLARMRDHIMTVVGRYKGRIKGWDVVNEALNEDGTLRRSPWLTIIGDDYIAKAFQFAHEADPAAELYYNDYSLENAPKRNGAVALVKTLQGGGRYGHRDRLAEPRQDGLAAARRSTTRRSPRSRRSASRSTSRSSTSTSCRRRRRIARRRRVRRAAAASARGESVCGRRCPTRCSRRWRSGTPISSACSLRTADVIDRVTFWGVGDGDSWLNNWPVPGRTSYPLLFDRAGSAEAGVRRRDAIGAQTRAAQVTTASVRLTMAGSRGDGQ